MKISNAFFFDRATRQVTDAQVKLSQTQAQLASGRQLLSPSDRPDQAQAIERLREASARQEVFAGQLRTVQARLEAEETALTSVNTILIRAKELSLQGADGTLGPQDRIAIAQELRQLREQLVTLANSRDDGGQYLFGGAAVGNPPFVADADGRVSYRGDQTPAWLVNEERDLLVFNRAGSEAFGRVVRDTTAGPRGVEFFDAVDDLIQAVADSDIGSIQRGIGEVDELLTSNGLALVKTGADQNAIDNQLEIVDETLLRLKSARSNLEDLDYAEAISRMNQQMLALESAMGSFARVSRLNLFEYLNP